jgi:predicted P-loop ATPase
MSSQYKQAKLFDEVLNVIKSTTPDKQQVALVPSVKRTKAEDITQISLTDFIAAVQSDEYKQQIEQLRTLKLTDSKKYSEEKKKLPAVAFGAYDGSVLNETYRPKSLLVFNGDVDGLKDAEHVNMLKDLVECHPAVVYCLISPSGLGLKIGVHVGPIQDAAHYLHMFTFINEWIKKEIHPDLILDNYCKDIRRLCFVSHDPSAYLNLEADILPTPSQCSLESVKAPVTPDIRAVAPYLEQETANLMSDFVSVESEIFAVITNKMLKAVDKTRHGVRLAMSRLAGGYIASGLINETKALELITTLSNQIAGGGCTDDDELKTIADGIAYGKKSPLTIDDFKKANGYNIAVFGPAVITTAKKLNLAKNADGTKTLATLDNIHQALSTPEYSGYGLGFDTFKDQVMYHTKDSLWQPLDNETPTLFRMELAKRFYKEIPAPIMRDAINYSARQNKFDSAKEWLNGLPVWDGVPRVKVSNAKYFKTENNSYTQSVGEYMWTALAARVLDPGCQCDMVVVYEGAQGDGKSSAVAAIAPRVDMATEISFLDDEDKSSRKLQGCVVAEISELRGINTKDEDSTKAFITRRYDRWIPKYKELAVEIPRRYILIGTTNNREFLADPTGQRRWLPVSCGKVDVAGIVKDRDQLWAEAAAIYRERGICWADAERLAVDAHEDFMVEDTWADPIKAYLNTPVQQGLQFALTTGHILYGALEIEPRNQKKCDLMRVAAVLRLLGFKRERRMMAGERIWHWAK